MRTVTPWRIDWFRRSECYFSKIASTHVSYILEVVGLIRGAAAGAGAECRRAEHGFEPESENETAVLRCVLVFPTVGGRIALEPILI